MYVNVSLENRWTKELKLLRQEKGKQNLGMSKETRLLPTVFIYFVIRKYLKQICKMVMLVGGGKWRFAVYFIVMMHLLCIDCIKKPH